MSWILVGRSLAAKCFIVIVAGAASAGSACAAIMLDAHPATGSSMVTPGQSVTINIDALTGSDVHNSAIFRVVWSRPGVVLTSYAWGTPYVSGGIFDDSIPSLASLPAVVDAPLLSGFGYPTDTADVEFSNVCPPGGPDYTTGTLLSFTFTVPANFEPGNLLISIAPDTFALGAAVKTVDTPPSLLLIVVPAPGAAGILGLACLSAMRARPRRVRDCSVTPTV